MYDICCIGHITSDKVVNTQTTLYMPGGTAFYFSYALNKLDVKYLLVTALAETEMHYVNDLRAKGIEIKVQPSAHTVYFENIYGENQDERTQNVLQVADRFNPEQIQSVSAKIFHLGPLLANDFSAEFVKSIAGRGLISLDVQGYLRKVENKKVYATGWAGKKEILLYIDILKADVAELRALTGCDELNDGIMQLTDWGVKEIVITNGSQGSWIYSDDILYTIPAHSPKIVIDATGCGDTYMAGYLYKRVNGVGIQESGEFAAAMSGLKTAAMGAFKGTEVDVIQFMGNRD
ncbi:Sugar or nucleoside kinase, ribokinase family [Mucilaginibacter mallensis]|uniref:Sugar or nucleoside kinase, ribokinase family n=1 Tax=Mucilaginibacter mallensis TaxID=652787 RepID=A0A1H1NMK0_MUCMA|nr:PfkB family carbohydrate kinase [Mucilaginibacter mallensis]SDS00222.1 Sugar or nucleoside kinase, ribokinase family [Mucilaginibacter mallensis]